MACSGNHVFITELRCQNFNPMYSHDLQMYSDPPTEEIILTDLQQLCAERLKVLKLVDRISFRNRRLSSKQRKAILVEELVKCDLIDFAKLINAAGCKSHTDMDLRLRRKDHISHFMLRSAFAFEYEKKLWFYKQEIRLFKWRFSSLDTEGIQTFNCINGFHYTSISKEEMQDVRDYLAISCATDCNMSEVAHYKVPFTDVLTLIRRRTVFLKGGMAFVPETSMVALFITHFKRNLCAGFEYAREIAVEVCSDERLTTIFKKLSSNIKILHSKFQTLGPTSIDELDELSEISYPLCMKVLHDALRTKHHLTNGGRVQYGLFLKGIGVSLSDSLQFWKGEFTKTMDEGIFGRKYAYHVRHLYGREGKRANYEPFDCCKIIRANVGARDHHGCPFKHMQTNMLAQELLRYHLTNLDIEPIVQLAREGYHFEACRKYYEITHGCVRNKLFKHPNQYFNESRNMVIDTSSDDDSIFSHEDLYDKVILSNRT